MALVWFYGKKQRTQKRSSRFLSLVFSRWGIIIFLGLVFLFAFIEEGLWDITYWKEHKNIFSGNRLINIQLDNSVLTFLVPLLALPQLTHYILDGFIWKVKDNTLKGHFEEEHTTTAASSGVSQKGRHAMHTAPLKRLVII